MHTGDSLDTDDPEHITWLYQKALTRAKEFNISGVTYSMTQGVVKNIIPAIASTNAIVAAACCNEAFKLATNSNPCLGMPGGNNYMMYSGDEGVYTYTFEHQKKDDCPVCGNLARPMKVDPNVTLAEFLEGLAERPEAYVHRPLGNPRSLMGNTGNLKNHHFERRRRRSTTNSLQVWRNRHDLIWRRNSRSSFHTERRWPYRIQRSKSRSSINSSSNDPR
jgi:hypothetical protein